MERRDFLKKSGLVAAGAAAAVAGLAGCAEKKEEAPKQAATETQQAPAVMTEKKYEWRMVTTWPPNLPVLQTGAVRFAQRVEELRIPNPP